MQYYTSRYTFRVSFHVGLMALYITFYNVAMHFWRGICMSVSFVQTKQQQKTVRIKSLGRRQWQCSICPGLILINSPIHSTNLSSQGKHVVIICFSRCLSVNVSVCVCVFVSPPFVFEVCLCLSICTGDAFILLKPIMTSSIHVSHSWTLSVSVLTDQIRRELYTYTAYANDGDN